MLRLRISDSWLNADEFLMEADYSYLIYDIVQPDKVNSHYVKQFESCY